MNSLKLRETMSQVQMGEQMQEEIIKNVAKQVEERRNKIRWWKKAAVSAAAFAVIIGVAIPIQAGIRYLVHDRLENIPEQELSELRQMMEDQEQVEADSYSREYSDEEKARLQQMKEAYQNGKFPEQVIVLADSSSIPEDTLSYISDTGTLHLPERTLTDEELLQIIDFQYTRDYAAGQSDAAKEAQKQQALKERRLEKEAEDKGWITEQDAKKAASKYLKAEFGVSAKDAECEIFMDQRQGGVVVYHVSYDLKDEHTMYGYSIDVSAEDGSLFDSSSASIPLRQ